MRKFGTIFLLLCLLLSLAACGSTDQTTGTADPAPAAQPAPTGDGAGSTLVAYFSWAENAVLSEDVDAITSPSVVPPGNVQQLAAWVQEATGGDLFSIQVTDPYPSDWDACLARANQERGEDARPALTAAVEDLNQYDTVFLGYPKMEQGYICV